MLYKIRKKQLCWFWIIVIIFSILGLVNISGIYKGYQKGIIENNRTYNYQQDNTYIEPQEVKKQDKEVLLPEIKEEEIKYDIVKNIDKEKNAGSVREQVINIINEAVNGINDANKSVNNFEGASCSGDCVKRIIDIKFIKDTYIWDFGIDSTMKTYATIIYDKLKEVKDVSVTINLIYGGELKHSYIASKQGVIIK